MNGDNQENSPHNIEAFKGEFNNLEGKTQTLDALNQIGSKIRRPGPDLDKVLNRLID